MMQRREFLKRSGIALVSTAAWGTLRRPSLASGAHAADKMKRVGCTTTCFRMLFPATRPKNQPHVGPELTLLEIPALFAERLGVHNVELWSLHFSDTSLRYCEKIRRAAEKAGSVVTNVQLDRVPYNLSHRDPAERKKSIEVVKQWMQRAAACGATSLRANTGHSEGREFDLDITTDSFGQLAEHGRRSNVKVLIENHGSSTPVPEKIVQIVKAVDSPFCRTLPDFGNMPKNADEPLRRRMLEMLFPYAHLASAKGQWFDQQGRHAPYDIGQCVQLGEACGFRGVYSAEYFDPQARPFDPVRVAKLIIDAVVENI